MITQIKFEEIIGPFRMSIHLDNVRLTDEQFFQFCQDNSPFDEPGKPMVEANGFDHTIYGKKDIQNG